ncbi:Gfo/Idh/MocA family protein [Paludibaculum fermentans]|uniref:Gfo/Idh/MocA family oxidoreductase n=1 Tax=Paludibaculum fermentans TaxID=1473598 RepID=A0A7S7NL10_PALFE|nr:Gfo/Idh/MocA family oxidoreductase [Paludibaculum fermentans]QOY85586.1 Gfo/Idh/MocA family oxidoreductase [Paludibaculum fermentans]
MRRRQFLVAASAAASQSWAGANDKVRVAVIGVGSRGTAHIKEMLPAGNIEVAAVVDPDGRRTEAAAAIVKKQTGKSPRIESDMRRVFDDKNIDAVTIATTNHWHTLTAIWAMQAGKDVYVEKPVSHNVWEGTKLVEAARHYNRMAAGGTQRRWWGRFRKAVELIHGGTIGDVYQGNFVFPGPRESIGFKPVQPPPAWLNWDLWLGPAPEQPYHENLVHYNWHWFWDFGNGEMGNNAIHLLDITRWAMKKTLPVRVHSTGGRFGYKDQAQTPNTQNATWVYEDGSMIVGQLRGLYTPEAMSWDFFGTKGHLHIFDDGRVQVTLGRNKQPEPEPSYPPDVDHFKQFAEAVRTRNRNLLLAEIEETAISTALCHLSNISYRVNRDLRFDPAKMQFSGDSEANGLLTRQYRSPYVVPNVV